MNESVILLYKENDKVVFLPRTEKMRVLVKCR